MPTYEYGCSNSHTWETSQKIADSPLTTCPTCGADAKRLISRTSFALKGSGWAANGYGASPAAPAAASAPTSGFSDAAVASATSCPTVTPTKT